MGRGRAGPGEKSGKAGDGTPAVFAKSREVIEGEGDALRSFAAECKECKRARSQGCREEELEGQPGGEA